MASAMCSPCLFFRTILTECNFHVLNLTWQNMLCAYLRRLLLKMWLPSEERGKLCCERRWEDLFRLRLLDELLGSSRWFSEWEALVLSSEEWDRLFRGCCCAARFIQTAIDDWFLLVRFVLAEVEGTMELWVASEVCWCDEWLVLVLSRWIPSQLFIVICLLFDRFCTVGVAETVSLSWRVVEGASLSDSSDR